MSSVNMKIHNLVFVLMITLFKVYGNRNFEECASLDGIERKCMRHQECPQDIQSLLDRRPKTDHDLEQLKITTCGYNGWKLCCPLPECYTWDGRPGKCLNHTNSLFTNMSYKQIKDSRCLNKPRSVCYSNLPVHQTSDCSSELSAFPPDPSSGCCGQQYPGVLYDLPTTYFLHPWFAVLKYPSSRKHCSGVLISTKYVLTAAHCVNSMFLDEKPNQVVLGKNNKDSIEDCLADAPCYDTVRETRPIEEIILHPQFDQASRLKRNDIALIRLDGILTSSAFIKPICLPIDTRDVTLTPSENFNLYSVGWGGHREDYLPSVNMKRQVKLQFVSPSDCMQSYENLWNRNMCASGESNTETCIGDTVGPLMRDRNGTFEILGIPSYSGSECGTNTLPTVYTKIYPYAVWIRNTIRP